MPLEEQQMSQSATTYLERLAKLLASARVTDGAGVGSFLDERARMTTEMLLATAGGTRKVMAIENGGSAAIRIRPEGRKPA